MIVIIDYGMGNLRSVQKSFERLKTPVVISSDEKTILNADKIVLPGVGNFEKGMINLKSNGFIKVLNEAVLIKQTPILGICLGMQLMTQFSEEGNVEGFGWIKAKTKKFIFEDTEFKVPHMGWNTINLCKQNPIMQNVLTTDLFYFVHSYYITCEQSKDVLTETNYGVNFVSSFENKNIFGFQFHPEKSHDAGLQILKNFVNL